ncbi:MAG: PAS domain S-box protein [Candidatus Melainabacteria bacterium]|jgi:PAS domain S-box-containing protein|nr:PAS domain S-box protein [Candidatus Melainabacteria bacterium]
MKLIHRGLILVMVPVAFEFIFVGTLFGMMHQAELEVARAEKARETITHLNRIQRHILVWVARLSPYASFSGTTGPAKAQLAASNVKEEFARLRKVISDQPEQLASVDKMEKSWDDGVRISAGLKDAGSMSSILNSNSGVQLGRGLMSGLLEESDAIRNQTEKIENESPERQAELREAMKIWLSFGLTLNVMLALGLAIYFNRVTATRIAVVVDNTRRFAAGMPLNEPLHGDDEFARLDKVFNSMAREINTLAEKERALLVHAVDVICSLDADGTISDISPACEKVWGYTVDELLSKRLMSIVVFEDQDATLEHISLIKKINADSTFENRIKRKDGSIVDMLWSLNWSPEQKTFFCVAHDNTERKNAERMKQDFVAMLSHDLRSPLNSVQAFFTMLREKIYGSLNDKGMNRAASLEGTVSWLIEMISDLLDIDKIEAGLADLDLRETSLLGVAERASEALSNLADESAVEIALPENDAKVVIDNDMFMRVVTNLLSNAIKYSPRESTVDVEIVKSEGFVEFRVIDRGPGIALENQDSVFERFKQLKESDTKMHRSSGLGLAVSKAIVEQHKGTIGVNSVPGEGSTFWVRLPSA